MADRVLERFVTEFAFRYNKSALAQLENSLGRIEERLRSASRTFLRLGTISTTNQITLFTRFSKTYEKGLAQIASKTGKTFKDIEKEYGESSKRIARETGRSLDRVFDGIQKAISAGVEGARAIKLVEAAARSAASGIGQLDEQVSASTTLMEVYGATAKESIDVVTRAAQVGEGETIEYANAFKQVAGMAHTLGINLHDVASGLSSISRVAPNVTIGATQFRSFLRAMLSPSMEAIEIAEQAGTSFAELRKMGQDKGLPALFDAIHKLAGNDPEKLNALVGRIEAMQFMTSITSKTLRDLSKEIKETAKDSVIKAFAQQRTWLEFQRLKQAIMEFSVAIGQYVVPPLKLLTNALHGMREYFENLPEDIKQFIGRTMRMGPVLLAIGGILWMLARIIKPLSVSMTLFAAHPLKTMSVSVALLAGSFYLLYRYSGKFTESWIKFRDRIGLKDFFDEISMGTIFTPGKIKEGLSKFTDLFSSKMAKEVGDTKDKQLSEAVGKATDRSLLEGVTKHTKKYQEFAAGVVSGAAKAMREAYADSFAEAIGGMVDYDLRLSLKSYVTGFGEFAQGIVQYIANAVKTIMPVGLIEALTGMVSQASTFVGESLVKGIASIFGMYVSFRIIKASFGRGLRYISGMYAATVASVIANWRAMGSQVGALKGIYNLVANHKLLLLSMGGAISALGIMIPMLISGSAAIEGFTSTVLVALNLFFGMFQGIAGLVILGMDRIMDNFTGEGSTRYINAVTGFFGRVFRNIIGWIGNLGMMSMGWIGYILAPLHDSTRMFRMGSSFSKLATGIIRQTIATLPHVVAAAFKTLGAMAFSFAAVVASFTGGILAASLRFIVVDIWLILWQVVKEIINAVGGFFWAILDPIIIIKDQVFAILDKVQNVANKVTFGLIPGAEGERKAAEYGMTGAKKVAAEGGFSATKAAFGLILGDLFIRSMFALWRAQQSGALSGASIASGWGRTKSWFTDVFYPGFLVPWGHRVRYRGGQKFLTDQWTGRVGTIEQSRRSALMQGLMWPASLIWHPLMQWVVPGASFLWKNYLRKSQWNNIPAGGFAFGNWMKGKSQRLGAWVKGTDARHLGLGTMITDFPLFLLTAWLTSGLSFPWSTAVYGLYGYRAFRAIRNNWFGRMKEKATAPSHLPGWRHSMAKGWANIKDFSFRKTRDFKEWWMTPTVLGTGLASLFSSAKESVKTGGPGVGRALLNWIRGDYWSPEKFRPGTGDWKLHRVGNFWKGMGGSGGLHSFLPLLGIASILTSLFGFGDLFGGDAGMMAAGIGAVGGGGGGKWFSRAGDTGHGPFRRGLESTFRFFTFRWAWEGIKKLMGVIFSGKIFAMLRAVLSWDNIKYLLFTIEGLKKLTTGIYHGTKYAFTHAPELVKALPALAKAGVQRVAQAASYVPYLLGMIPSIPWIGPLLGFGGRAIGWTARKAWGAGKWTFGKAIHPARSSRELAEVADILTVGYREGTLGQRVKDSMYTAANVKRAEGVKAALLHFASVAPFMAYGWGHKLGNVVGQTVGYGVLNPLAWLFGAKTKAPTIPRAVGGGLGYLTGWTAFAAMGILDAIPMLIAWRLQKAINSTGLSNLPPTGWMRFKWGLRHPFQALGGGLGRLLGGIAPMNARLGRGGSRWRVGGGIIRGTGDLFGERLSMFFDNWDKTLSYRRQKFQKMRKNLLNSKDYTGAVDPIRSGGNPDTPVARAHFKTVSLWHRLGLLRRGDMWAADPTAMNKRALSHGLLAMEAGASLAGFGAMKGLVKVLKAVVFVARIPTFLAATATLLGALALPAAILAGVVAVGFGIGWIANRISRSVAAMPGEGGTRPHDLVDPRYKPKRPPTYQELLKRYRWLHPTFGTDPQVADPAYRQWVRDRHAVLLAEWADYEVKADIDKKRVSRGITSTAASGHTIDNSAWRLIRDMGLPLGTTLEEAHGIISETNWLTRAFRIWDTKYKRAVREKYGDQRYDEANAAYDRKMNERDRAMKGYSRTVGFGSIMYNWWKDQKFMIHRGTLRLQDATVSVLDAITPAWMKMSEFFGWIGKSASTTWHYTGGAVVRGVKAAYSEGGFFNRRQEAKWLKRYMGYDGWFGTYEPDPERAILAKTRDIENRQLAWYRGQLKAAELSGDTELADHYSHLIRLSELRIRYMDLTYTVMDKESSAYKNASHQLETQARRKRLLDLQNNPLNNKLKEYFGEGMHPIHMPPNVVRWWTSTPGLPRAHQKGHWISNINSSMVNPVGTDLPPVTEVAPTAELPLGARGNNVTLNINAADTTLGDNEKTKRLISESVQEGIDAANRNAVNAAVNYFNNGVGG